MRNIGPISRKVSQVLVKLKSEEMLWSSGGGVLMACALVAAGVSSESPFSGSGSTQSSEHEYLITVNGKLDASIHEALDDHGATVTGYLGKGRLLVHGSDEVVESLKSHEKIASVQVRDARDKIASLVSQDDKRTGRRLTDEKKKNKATKILVNLHDKVAEKDQVDTENAIKESINAFLRKDDAVTVEEVKPGRFVVSLPSACTVADLNMAQLRAAGFATVSTVEPVEDFKLLNTEARSITRGSTVTDPSLINLTGEGEIVGVADTGLDYNMCFFRDENEEVAVGSGNTVNHNHRKVVQYNPFTDAEEGQVMGHGTHVCGSIAGSSEGEFSEYNGMAPNAKISFFDASPPGSGSIFLPGDMYNDLLMDPYLLGARLHSDSWGSSTNTYTTTSRDFDAFMYDQKEFLVLVAAGNGGTLGDASIGSPASFKNGVAVGASGNLPGGWREQDQHDIYHEQVVYFSSRGPTSDGRLKPDVLAPGDVVTSASSDVSMDNDNCGVGGMSGTSMSTPITAGTAALVREYYTKGYYPTGQPSGAGEEPSAALVKATLIHSGQAVYGKRPAPSFTQGFGRVNLENVLVGADSDFDLFVVDPKEDLERALVTGDVSRLCFNVEDTHEFKVTLVWTDAPGVVGTTHALVNDLALEVVQHGGADTLSPDLGADSVTAVGNHRFNEDGAVLSVDGAGVTFGFTTLGATLDITPPLTAPESVIASACAPISGVAGKVFVHDESLDASVCTILEAATNVQNAGGVAMVVKTSTFEEMTVIDTDSESSIAIPVVTTDDISSFVAGAEVKLGVEEKHQLDNKNNVEQVRVRHSGLVTVSVFGAEVATPEAQNYALVITGKFAEATECPAAECPICVNGGCTDGECVCDEFWTGAFCDVEVCPDMCSGNGDCTLDGCVCEDGYRGDGCEISHCDGTVTLTGDGGIITHDLVAGKPYQNNMFCIWEINPEVPNTNIRFSWGEGDVDLETGWDYLYLVDGVDPYTSYLLTDPITGVPPAEDGIFSTFYGASVVFYSDFIITSDGFNVQWDALTCLDDCNDSGECPDEPESDGTCECEEGSSGPGCGMETCTETSCLNGGECTHAGVCQCPVNWWGETCDWTGQCQGLAVYTAIEGTFADGSGPVYTYWNFLDCGFLVNPEGVSRIEFTLNEFHLEDGFDFVYVYDDLQRTNLLATLTGYIPGQSFEFETRSLYFLFETDPSLTLSGFDISYTAHYDPPVFSMDEYTFTFIGDAMTINDPWRDSEGVFVGSVSASDPAQGDIIYSLHKKDTKTYSIGESDGVISVEDAPESGFIYKHVVQACSSRSGLCDRARVVMVVLNRDGCLADGECPDSGPVLSPPFHFKFEGGREAEGEVVGRVKAVDPVYDNAVVRYRTPDEGAELANVYFEVQSNGDIVCIKSLEKYMKGDVIILPVVVCSVSGCSSVDVELEVVRN